MSSLRRLSLVAMVVATWGCAEGVDPRDEAAIEAGLAAEVEEILAEEVVDEAPAAEDAEAPVEDDAELLADARRVVPVDAPEIAERDAVAAGNLSILVPPRGMGVTLAVEDDDGTYRELVVTHGADGKVLTRHRVDAPGHLHLAADHTLLNEGLFGTPSECTDARYKLSGHKWNKRYDWRMNVNGLPSGVTASGAESATKYAAANIVNGRNKCSYLDRISATHSYLGRTAKTVNIASTTTSISCRTPDEYNVIQFGALPSTTLAVTCAWWDAATNVALYADIKINKGKRWFTGRSTPSGCSNRFGLEGVMTHEFGHVWGLNHVSPGYNLTMGPYTKPCTNAAATLGRGDLLGLMKLY